MQGGDGANVDAPEWVDSEHKKEAYRFLNREVEFYGGEHESPNWMMIKSLIEGMRREERVEAWLDVEQHLEYDRQTPTGDYENIVEASLENQLVTVRERGTNTQPTTRPDTGTDSESDPDSQLPLEPEPEPEPEPELTQNADPSPSEPTADEGEAELSDPGDDDEPLPPEFREENQTDPDVIQVESGSDQDAETEPESDSESATDSAEEMEKWERESSQKRKEEDRSAGQAGLADF